MRRNSILALAATAAAGYVAARVLRERRARSIPSGAHVVILGAGFGGFAAAERLSSRTRGRVRMTLIDRDNYHLFTPMLYEVASCAVEPYDVAVQLRPLLAPRGVQFRKATVTGVDFDKQEVQLDGDVVAYNYLILALGSTTNFFGNASAQRYALPMKSLEDGLTIRNHVIDMLEQASRSSNPDEQRALLTFVIVGGGATGVETAGAMADIVRHVVSRNYPALNERKCRVVVIEAAPALLGHMGAQMAAVALDQLKSAGVEVLLRTKAKEVGPDRVWTEDGREIPARTVIWATGVCAPEVIERLPVSRGHGGSIRVNECLQTFEHPNVFAIGDSAEVGGRNGVPLLAAAAMQEGEAVAENIVRALRGRPLANFRYRKLGNAVSVGHGAGVAKIAGRVIGGFPGWLTWRLVHLARIATFRNKTETLLDWTAALFYDVDTARLEVEAKPKVA